MSYDNYQQAFRRNRLSESGTQLYTDRDIFTPTVGQKFMMGCQFETDDGRRFRYCKNGAVALTRAFLVSSEAPASQGLEIAQTGYTTSVGDKRFDILLTTGHNYANEELREGFLYVNKGTAGALGDCYVIAENIIKTNDTVMTIEIADETGIRSATVATDEISIIKSPYRDVVVTPTTQAAIIVGVPLEDVTANYYFWAQYKGPCPVIVDTSETVVIGEPVGYPGTPNVAGAIGPIATDTDTYIGNCMTVGAAAEPAMVMLDIA